MRTRDLLFLTALLVFGSSCSSSSTPAGSTGPTPFKAILRGKEFVPVSVLAVQSGFAPVKYVYFVDQLRTCEQLIADLAAMDHLSGRYAQVAVFWDRAESPVDNNTSFIVGPKDSVPGDHGSVKLSGNAAAGGTAHMIFDAHSATDQDSLVGALDVRVCN